jgi:hypothetical protein
LLNRCELHELFIGESHEVVTPFGEENHAVIQGFVRTFALPGLGGLTGAPTCRGVTKTKVVSMIYPKFVTTVTLTKPNPTTLNLGD